MPALIRQVNKRQATISRNVEYFRDRKKFARKRREHAEGLRLKNLSKKS
jgi:hypothetical protein